MNKRYFGEWESCRKRDVAESFNAQIDESAHILFACYEQGDYTGAAYVLFEQQGKLFEVAGSHCSCYGLEGQWEPSEVTPEALAAYHKGSSYYVEEPDAHAALERLIARLQKKHKVDA